MTASSPETVRCLWEMFFPDVPLTQTIWLQRYGFDVLKQGLQVAVDRENAGEPWNIRDEENIGRYVNKVCQYIQNTTMVTQTVGGDLVITVQLHLRGGYRITGDDRDRFKKKVERDGPHLIWHGAKGTSGYGRFQCNGRLEGAHIFSFFDHNGGVLPAREEQRRHRLQIAHSCIRRHDCVDPRHLTLATQALNLQERYAAGRVTESAKEEDYSSGIGTDDTQSFTCAPQCATTSPIPLSNVPVALNGNVANSLNDQQLAPCLTHSFDGYIDDSLLIPEDPYDSI